MMNLALVNALRAILELSGWSTAARRHKIGNRLKLVAVSETLVQVLLDTLRSVGIQLEGLWICKFYFVTFALMLALIFPVLVRRTSPSHGGETAQALSTHADTPEMRVSLR